MIKKEMIEKFGLSRGTLNNWEKSEDGRKLLYEVLSSLPLEYVEKIEKQIEDEKKREELLR